MDNKCKKVEKFLNFKKINSTCAFPEKSPPIVCVFPEPVCPYAKHVAKPCSKIVLTNGWAVNLEKLIIDSNIFNINNNNKMDYLISRARK